MQPSPQFGNGFPGLFQLPTFSWEATFDSWHECQSAIQSFCDSTFQPFRIRDSSLVGSRCTNTSLKYQMVLLKCTHGGVARSRGSGIRPRQNYRYLGCNAFIKFAAKRDIGRDDFVLRCVEQYTGHSHECCKEAYDMLSENRKVSDPQTIKDAAIMLKTKGNKKLIRDELASRTGKRIIMKGIHNLNARLNLDPPGCDDDSRTLLEQFTSQAGNVADIITDENDEVVFICIQTAFQRDMMQAYPEVLLVDATHKTNRNGYQMLGIMGHTSLGSGFPFFVALNSSSTKENLTAVLKSFKEHNPSWTHSVFGVIDKDFVEEDVLTATMPDVFWIRKNMIATGVAYFMERWCSAFRDVCLNMGNTTNNRLESAWGDLKTFLESRCTMFQCLQKLLAYLRYVEDQFSLRSLRL
ncbi:unnamed protein product (mitochondrion) [Plasmodiophora brassicae]|uniref:ZSWIM1/3 RNaseH-like domain-containing protein n=1 Tax=Plasmodiophora brassicae TaxID=37360 RepID=A0A3P3Y8U7_PLABS|nr:unnamed protein product [Plasmodiophora brassicae]